MADKDRTPPDLLGSLLTGKKSQTPAPQPEEPTEAFTAPPEQVKATYYLSTSILAKLDEAWLKLRKATGKRVSKGEIVEASLQMALEQMEELTKRVK